MRRKPAPKSVQNRKFSSNRNFLGESDADASSEQASDDNSTHRTRAAYRSEFRSPELDNNATDYGLEFTTSRLASLSTRRRSTVANSQQQSDDVPHSSRNTAAEETNTGAKQKKLPAENTAGEHVQRKRRKRRNPIQLERRYQKEVIALQNRTDNLVPLLPFSRLVREIIMATSTEVTKITPTALEAIQISAEMYITQTLEDAYMLTLHRGRVTLSVKDMELLKYLKFDLLNK